MLAVLAFSTTNWGPLVIIRQLIGETYFAVLIVIVIVKANLHKCCYFSQIVLDYNVEFSIGITYGNKILVT